MKANDMTNEEISAFADGELPAQRVDMVAQTLRQLEGQTCWDVYHQIGDVLRSDDMAIAFSCDFAARMSARLDVEPVFILPTVGSKTGGLAVAKAGPAAHSTSGRVSGLRRLTMPGLVAAAAAVAYIGFPQLMVASNGFSNKSPIQTVSIPAGDLRLAAGTGVAKSPMNASSAAEVVVLRDPRIDEYLLAHQRFSPSVYSSAQFARSATFASDSNK